MKPNAWYHALPTLLLAASLATPFTATTWAAEPPGTGSQLAIVSPPEARGWRVAGGVGQLRDLGVGLTALQGEQLVGAWRVLDTAPEGPYVYLIATATNLQAYPDVKSAADLAQAKLGSASLPQAGAVAGLPTTILDTQVHLSFPDGVSLDGITIEDDDPSTANELDWRTRHVFVLQGDMGYDFQLASTDPKALQDRMTDFAKILESVRLMDSAPATSMAPAAPTSAVRLDRTPQVGQSGDVLFTFPDGRGWTDDAGDVGRLDDLMRLADLGGEQLVGAWRVLDTAPEGPYVYLIATATNLDAHPDLKSAGDLADKTLAAACASDASCVTDLSTPR